jgi:hypothetical protein
VGSAQAVVDDRLRVLGTLASGLGHDIANALLPVRVRLDAMRRAGLSRRQRADADSIGVTLDHLQKLAEGLRLLARDPTRADPRETTEPARWWAVTEPLLRAVLPPGVDLHGDTGEAGVRVRVGMATLTRIAFNLVQNSADALALDGERVVQRGEIRVRFVSSGGGVAVEFADNGPGMPADVLARCVDPYFTTKARGVATGLGLWTVYGLARSAGGRVEVRSRPEHGVVVTVHLAAVAAGADALKPMALVQVSDPRLRSFIVGELRAMGYAPFTDLQDDAVWGVQIVETDETMTRQAGTIIVLGDAPDDPSLGPALGRVVYVGARPGPVALRNVLRSIGPAAAASGLSGPSIEKGV